MFIPGSVKSSKWGWDIKVYPSKYGNTSTQSSNAGFFTGGCLAPNGLIYCLPTYIGAQYVTVIKPGKSNSQTGKWEAATITNVPATGGAKNALLPDITTEQAALQRRFSNKGILAPNGLIYFFGFLANSYVVVKPQDDPDWDITASTEWKVVTYASVGLEPVANRSGYGGGFLHTDGKIYLLPQQYGLTTGTSAPIARIIPRDDYQSSDTIQKSAFWTPGATSTTLYKYFPTSASFSTVNNFPKPGDIDGVQITVPLVDTYAPNYYSTNDGIGPMPPIGDAISHPNGEIYIFGGARNAYILKLKTDDTTWNSNTTAVGRPLFYTNNDLRVPNNLPSGYSDALGLQGSFMSGSIEKLRLGQDPSTAKIYLHYAGTWTNDSSIPTGYFENNYTRTIVFDPVTETFENVGDQVTTIATSQQPFNLKPGIRMANGHIFSISNPLSTDKNRYGQLIISGDTLIDENKMIGPTTRRSILSDGDVSTINNSCYGDIDMICNQGSHALTGSALGKTFVTAPWAAFEITSVKGFYPGIRYFNYSNNQNFSFTSELNNHTGIVFNTTSQFQLDGIDLTSQIQAGHRIFISQSETTADGGFLVEDISFQFGATIIDIDTNQFTPGTENSAVFTYGQVIEFPSGGDILRIWNIDLSNSMYNVQYVTISGSDGTPSNNGVKLIYSGSDIVYSGQFSEIIFSPGTFTESDYQPTTVMSYQYALNDSAIYDIPSDLSTLPTSLYNAYHNKPR